MATVGDEFTLHDTCNKGIKQSSTKNPSSLLVDNGIPTTHVLDCVNDATGDEQQPISEQYLSDHPVILTWSTLCDQGMLIDQDEVFSQFLSSPSPVAEVNTELVEGEIQQDMSKEVLVCAEVAAGNDVSVLLPDAKPASAICGVAVSAQQPTRILRLNLLKPKIVLCVTKTGKRSTKKKTVKARKYGTSTAKFREPRCRLRADNTVKGKQRQLRRRGCWA